MPRYYSWVGGFAHYHYKTGIATDRTACFVSFGSTRSESSLSESVVILFQDGEFVVTNREPGNNDFKALMT